jgi:hypothetical protein
MRALRPPSSPFPPHPQLPPPLARARRSQADSDARAAAALGYLAALVDLAATYTGVTLRYPLAPRASVSYISDPVPPSLAARAGHAAPAPAPPPPPPLPSARALQPGGAAAVAAAPGGEWRLLGLATGALAPAPAPPHAALSWPAAPASPDAAAAAAFLPSPSAAGPLSAHAPPAASPVGLLPGPRGVGAGGRLAVFSALLSAHLDPRVAATPAGAAGDDAHPSGEPASPPVRRAGVGARAHTECQARPFPTSPVCALPSRLPASCTAAASPWARRPSFPLRPASAGLAPSGGLPLFPPGADPRLGPGGGGARDRTRFAFALHLLGKDVEALLAAHGLPPLAPPPPPSGSAGLPGSVAGQGAGGSAAGSALLVNVYGLLLAAAGAAAGGGP